MQVGILLLPPSNRSSDFSAMTPLHRKQRKEPASKLEIQHNESFEELILNAEQKRFMTLLSKTKKI